MACVTPARPSREQTLNPLIHLYVYLLVVFVGFILCNQLVNVRPRATNTKLSCFHKGSKCMCCFERHKHHWKQSGLYSSIQKHKTAINYHLYIIALAVSDLLCETVAMPLASVTLIIGWWNLIDFVCQIQSFVGILTTDVTPATDGLIAFNRYVKIVKTNHYKKIFSPRRSKIWLSCLWLSLVIYLFIAQVTNSANIYPKLCNVLLYLPK